MKIRYIANGLKENQEQILREIFSFSEIAKSNFDSKIRKENVNKRKYRNPSVKDLANFSVLESYFAFSDSITILTVLSYHLKTCEIKEIMMVSKYL